MTNITEILAALERYSDAERQMFIAAYENVFCRDCGGYIEDCDCWVCKTCGHFDKLSCRCAAARREAAKHKGATT